MVNLSMEAVVMFVLYLLGAGCIFGLLLYLINYIESNFPDIGLFAKFARIGLVVLAVLVLIMVILSFIGHPLVTFNGGGPGRL